MSDQGPTYIWEKINQYYQATRKPVHVAVAYTADAAAASLTIASLLKASLISYDIQPVATTEELRAMIAGANLAQEYAQLSDTDPFVDEFFLLVGIGGTIALDEYFDLARRHIVVVLDACRPFHLSNLRRQDDERLMIWGADRIREEVDSFFRAQRQAAAQQRRRRRRRSAIKRRRRLRRQYGGGAEDDSDNQEPSAMDVADESSSSSSSSADDDGDNSDDGDDSISLSQSQERVDWSNPADVPPYLEVLYYACERAGRSCALEAHDLSVLLNRYKDATLWRAAVGVSDLLVRRLIDYATYLVEMRPLHDAVTLQRSVRRGEAARTLYDDGDEARNNDPSDDAGDGGVAVSSSAAALRRRSTNAMELHNRDEEQLLLLRHTSLWAAIWHHPVTASVLRLHHTEDGEGVLRQLLARCGVSARVAQQPWREVPQADKAEALRLVQAELRQLMESRAKFLTFPNEIRCISRTAGFSTEVSTFDACTLHEALLAAVPPPSTVTLEVGFAGDAAAARALVTERLRKFHREQFWKAHAILDMDASAAEFGAAVQEALDLQRAVAVATSALMQPGMLQSTAGLHYIIPSDPTRTTTALESFSTVSRLGALSRRLLLTLTVERGLGRYTHAVRPLLLACALPRPLYEDAEQGISGFATTSTVRAGRTAGALNEVSMNALPLAPGAKAQTAAATGVGADTPDMLLTAAVATTGGGDGGLAGGAGEEHEFLVLLSHAGAGSGARGRDNGSALSPISAVGRLLACVHDPEEFDIPPQQRHLVQRTAVVVSDRATAAHLADAMYLACLSSKWDPQKDYLAAVAEAQEAQQGDEDDHEVRGASDIDDGPAGGDSGGSDVDDGDGENGDDDDEDRYFGEALGSFVNRPAS